MTDSTFFSGFRLLMDSLRRWNPLKKVESIEEKILMSYTFLSVGHLNKAENKNLNGQAMLKIKSTLIILFMFLITSASYAQEADAIIGNYKLPNKLDIKIYKYKNKFYGKIIALNGFEDGQTKDVNNPDESKQTELLLGKTIINHLEYDKKKKQWINGKMYGPEKGMNFDLKIKANLKDAIEIEASKFFFWKTMEWEKIKV